MTIRTVWARPKNDDVQPLEPLPLAGLGLGDLKWSGPGRVCAGWAYTWPRPTCGQT